MKIIVHSGITCNKFGMIGIDCSTVVFYCFVSPCQNQLTSADRQYINFTIICTVLLNSADSVNLAMNRVSDN